MHPIFTSIAIAGPETVLTLGSLAALMLGTFSGKGKALTVTSLFAVAILALAGFTLLDAPAGITRAFDGLYVADDFSAFLKVIILAAAAASVLLALPWLNESGSGRFEYPVLLLLATLGMTIMVSANDLLTLYVGLELAALPSYVLAAFHRQDDRSAEAGLKYFVLGALASGILLYGVTLIYGFSGSTQLDVIAGVVSGQAERSIGLLFGIVFILSGLAFKVSAVPFHMWTPDVYEGAPTPVAAFFSAAPKAAALGLMARVLIVAFPGKIAADWQQILIFISIASMVLGAVAAVAQTNIKRLLAYSSIANIGFALVGLTPGTPAGISALLFYVSVYVAMTLGSFLVVLQLRRPDGSPVETMADFAGLSKTQPKLAAALAIFMFSLAGIPPLLGFWPKFAVFQAAIASGLIALALIGFVASVVAAFYYLRLIKIMYFDEPGVQLASEGSPVNGAMIAACALFCSPIGMLAISPLVAATARAAAALFPGLIDVTHLPEVGSTNDWLLARAEALPDGHWVITDRQTAGRGRRGRVWNDGVGNFMGSVLVKAQGQVQQLSFVAALALHDALSALTGQPARFTLKWPNDVLLDGTKCSGILLERQKDALVIGMGINLAHHPTSTERPATSLAAAGLPVPTPAALLDELAAAFHHWRGQWAAHGFAPIRAAWLARASGVGTRIVARLGHESPEGVFTGLADDGALLMQLDDGSSRAIHAGEVFAL